MAEHLKKIVAPVQGKEGKKPFWMQIGIMGMKNGKLWMKFNVVPTGWDGYCMGVEMDTPKNGEAEKAEANKPVADAPEEGGGPYEEGPGF